MSATSTESPFFPSPSSSRPAPTPTTVLEQTSSDSSIETVASLASVDSAYSTSSSSYDSISTGAIAEGSSSSSSKRPSPYSTLVIQDLTPSPKSAGSNPGLSVSMLGLGLGVGDDADGRSSKSAPTSRRGSNVDAPVATTTTTTLTGPQYTHSLSGTPEASPALSSASSTSMTSPPTTASEASPSTSPSTGFFRPALPPIKTSSSSPIPSPPIISQSYHSRNIPAFSPSPPKPPFMTRSGSNNSLPSPTNSTSTAANSTRSPLFQPARPGSSGTFSTTSSNRSSTFSALSGGSGSSATGSMSTRGWVRDGEASDSCSLDGGKARGLKSGGMRWEKEGLLAVEGSVAVAESQNANVEGEVYKVASDGMEFLDPRPEPAGAKLSLNRDDPLFLVLRIVLPGFSLDNITVAMRRGHKVHIVADSYGESGGHFEKLVSLGPDVQSSAPRAEFNGTELRVYIKRRLPSHSNSPVPLSRSNTATQSDNSGSKSPSHFSPSSPNSRDAPIVTRSTGPSLGERTWGKALCGPEGAKAAAKVAKEEAALRAKEQAKTLPKPTRRLPFAGKRATSPAILESPTSPAATAPVAADSEEAGTIGRATKLTLSVPDSAPTSVALGSTSGTRSRSSSRSTTRSAGEGSSSSSSTETTSSSSAADSLVAALPPSGRSPSPLPSLSPSNSTPSSPARPKFESNITLRPTRSTFVEAAAAHATKDDDGRSSSGGVTPRGEKMAFSFAPFTRGN